jgi:hypothetical protein
MAGAVQRRKRYLGELGSSGENESQEEAVRPICATAWRSARVYAAA